MKKTWICCWEVIPGDGEHTRQFSTIADAKQAMRQKIAECVDLKEYILDLEPCAASFLGEYFSNSRFPKSAKDVPIDYEEPARGELVLDSSFIRWDHPYGAFPRMNTNLVLDDAYDEDYTFDFWYEYPEDAADESVKALSIHIYPHVDYGTSAYPLLILGILSGEPRTQEQIIQEIAQRYDTRIDRKAVGRHLEMLVELGFPVEHTREGYYLGAVTREMKCGIKYKTSAYPILVWQVLDTTPKTQEGIIQAIFEKYRVKIERKAVRRHLTMLAALGYNIQKCPRGYYIEA